MPESHSKWWPVGHYLATVLVAAVVLGVGLGREGLWQPTELRMADVAREGATRPADSAHPPLQLWAARVGFAHFGSNEAAGRIPTALMAVLAALALALAVGSVADARTGAWAGVAYVTMPLVFLNARHAIGGGVAQSMFTFFFAAVIAMLWARPPPGRWQLAWNVIRWALLAAIVLPALGSGWMLGALPVLLGCGLAVVLRWKHETSIARQAGCVLLAAGAALGFLCARRFFQPVTNYSPLFAVGADAHAPSPFSTFDSVIEQIGLATFPWVGILCFAVVRIAQPPPVSGTKLGTDGEFVPDEQAWRESGARIGSLMTATAAVGLHTVHWQQFGPSPFLGAATLAAAIAFTLRDAEREARPWRLVASIALLGNVNIVRDYILFPKTAYAAFGLADGGPNFPNAFTGKTGDWFKQQGIHAFGALFTGHGITEAFAIVEAAVFTLIALAALFLGAGGVAYFRLARPYQWLGEVETRASEQLESERESGGEDLTLPRWFALQLVAYLRFTLVGLAAILTIALEIPLHWMRTLSPIAIANLKVLQYVPFGAIGGIIVGVYVVLALWNFDASVERAAFRQWIERRVPIVGAVAFGVALVLPSAARNAAVATAWTAALVLGTCVILIVWRSRLGFVAVGAIAVALLTTQTYFPALSEHLSPHSVWAAIRQVRGPAEPVARYGTTVSDATARYYGGFEVRNLQTEHDAVDWLRQVSPRHFLVTAGDSFPALNAAYRASFEPAQRHNIVVADSTNPLSYLTASTAVPGGMANPFDAIVLSRDTQIGPAQTDHWHAHGRHEDRRFVQEPAQFGDSILYLGYNLDSGGMSYVPIGGSFRITYHFETLRPLAGNYQLFVHVEGPGARSNADHETGGGKYPVRYWLAGDFIHDEQRITLPSSGREGTYVVYIGFYQGTERMPVSGGDHDSQNRVVAASINVR